MITRRNSLAGLAGFIGACTARAPLAHAADYEAPHAVAAYEDVTGGHAGFYARNVLTGAALGWRADERFVLCSTFKASLVALVLRQADRGTMRLDTHIAFTAADIPDWYAPAARANLARGVMSVAEMCQAAVQQSDNTCATLLLARVGGPAAVTAFWRECGDRVSRLDDGEPEVNRTPPGGLRNTTTPRAMAENFRRFLLGDILQPPSRALLKTWLIGTVTGLDRLRAGLPAGWVVGDKTGHNGVDASGDIAIAWPRAGGPILMCAYTRGGRPNDAAFDALFKGIGQLVAARLG